MFVIAIPKEERNELKTGVGVKINGKPEVLQEVTGYLCYAGNRCKILDEYDDGELIHFACASHGCEDAKHTIIHVSV